MNGKVGVFVNCMTGYQGKIISDVRESARQEDLDVDVFDAQHNAVLQARDLIRFVNQNAGNAGNKLCVFVIPEADAPAGGGDAKNDPTFTLARRVLGKGVGWIWLNHGREDLIESLRKEFNDLPVAMMAIDNVEFGRIQGKQLRNLLPKGGMVLCVKGNPFDTASRERTTGMQHELQHGGISAEIIEARWEADIAETVVHKWITSPIRRRKTLDAVVSQNDYMAMGARRALSHAADELGRPELTQIPVIGGDGLPGIGLPWIDEGILTATVCVTLPGRPAVEQLARHWRDGSTLPPVTRLAVRSHPALGALKPTAR